MKTIWLSSNVEYFNAITRKYYQQLRATIRLFNKVSFYVNKHRLVPMKATN